MYTQFDKHGPLNHVCLDMFLFAAMFTTNHTDIDVRKLHANCTMIKLIDQVLLDLKAPISTLVDFN